LVFPRLFLPKEAKKGFKIAKQKKRLCGIKAVSIAAGFRKPFARERKRFPKAFFAERGKKRLYKCFWGRICIIY